MESRRCVWPERPPPTLQVGGVPLEGCRWSRGGILAGWLLAEALDVDGDGGEHVLKVGFGLPAVAAVAHAVAVGELADGALDAGPDGVALCQAGSCWPARLQTCSSGSSRGAKPTVRLPSLEVVHVSGAGQGWHWLLVKRAAMTGAPGEDVRSGPCQPLLTWPCGQVTSWRS